MTGLEPEDISYVKEMAQCLCKGDDQMRYVLAAIATAVQEWLGEDVILCPRKRCAGERLPTRPNVLSVRFSWRDREIWRHYVYYGMPDRNSPADGELLRVTLDVAHELGHLVLDRGPGRIPARTGIPESDKKTIERVREIEADWFALCILQMYGFTSAVSHGVYSVCD